MKQLVWKLVLPLTIISFAICTKWWYVNVDGFNEVLTGFPLPYMCPGWHTSLSLQIFVSELIIDILTYFVFWFITVAVINKYLTKIRLNKALTMILLSLSGLLTVMMIWIASLPEHLYYLNREFELEVIETGYKFIWDAEYKPEIKKE